MVLRDHALDLAHRAATSRQSPDLPPELASNLPRPSSAPRLLLLSIWALGRVLICTTGLIIIIAFCIPTYYRDALAAKQDPHTPGMLATCASDCF